MNRLRKIAVQDGIEYWQYTPTSFKLYADCYSSEEKPPYFSRLIHCIRMLRELWFAHYVVIYMKQGEKTLGHLVVSRGGTRIAMSKKEDIVIGPIWIVPQERGKGYGSAGIKAVLHSLGFEYQYAYEYIEEENISSIRTVEKNGYVFIGKGKEYGLMKTIRLNDEGKLLLYRLKK